MTLTEQRDIVLKDYLVWLEANDEIVSPDLFWRFMRGIGYSISITKKMLVEFGGYKEDELNELLKLVLRFKRSLMVFMQTKLKYETLHTSANKKLFSEAVVSCQEDYKTLRLSIGIDDHIEPRFAEHFSAQVLRCTYIQDESNNYKCVFDPINDYAIINKVIKYYRDNKKDNVNRNTAEKGLDIQKNKPDLFPQTDCSQYLLDVGYDKFLSENRRERCFESFFTFAESIDYGIIINRDILFCAGVSASEYDTLIGLIIELKILTKEALDKQVVANNATAQLAQAIAENANTKKAKKEINALSEKAKTNNNGYKSVVDKWYIKYKQIRAYVLFKGCCEKDAFIHLSNKIVAASYANNKDEKDGYVYGVVDNIDVFLLIIELHKKQTEEYKNKSKADDDPTDDAVMFAAEKQQTGNGLKENSASGKAADKAIQNGQTPPDNTATIDSIIIDDSTPKQITAQEKTASSNYATQINESITASKETAINREAINSTAPDTIVNSALYQLGQIPVGTVLCGKYTVESEMNVISGEAALYICSYQNQKYVAKIYRRNIAIKEEVTEALKDISSPYVAKLFDTGSYNGLPFEIIPYYKNGSLQGHTFSFDEMKEHIIPCLNEGLHVLHSNNIIHKDLKPSNIMLCDNGRDIVIIDFGISSVKEGSNTIIVTNTGMTPEYSASETFRNLFLEESDYYSLGITLYELFCGKTPYYNMSPEEIEQYVSIQRIPFPTDMPIELCNLIAGLTYNDISYRKIKNNPNRRWTYKEVINWCNGVYQQIPGEVVISAANQIPAYTFLKQKYTKLTDLVNALAKNWNEGKKQLFRGIMSGFFKAVDPEIAGYCMDAEDAHSEGGNPDLLFFQTIYKICPTIRTFYWRGAEFPNLTELGNNILERLRKADRSNYGMYDEILYRHVIAEYVRMKEPENEKLIMAALSLEARFIKHHSDEHEKLLAYYMTGYMLSGQRTLIILGRSYSSVDEVVQELHNRLRESQDAFAKMCSELIDSTGTLQEQFEAWLITIGKHEELQKWRMMEYGTK